MSVELAASSVVIVANRFNPSIFSQLWLVRNDIVCEDDFRPESVFTDEVAKIESREFGLLVVPPQLQFVPNTSTEEQAGLVWRKIGAIVRSLPHTPYSAVGLNFQWKVNPEGQDFRLYARKLFGVGDSALHKEFGSEDSRYGAYYSKNWKELRLRLDIKPASQKTEEGKNEFLTFAFNFHKDLDQQNAVSTLEQAASRWEEARNYSETITRLTDESHA